MKVRKICQPWPMWQLEPGVAFLWLLQARERLCVRLLKSVFGDFSLVDWDQRDQPKWEYFYHEIDKRYKIAFFFFSESTVLNIYQHATVAALLNGCAECDSSYLQLLIISLQWGRVDCLVPWVSMLSLGSFYTILCFFCEENSLPYAWRGKREGWLCAGRKGGSIYETERLLWVRAGKNSFWEVGDMNSFCGRHLVPYIHGVPLYARGGGHWALQPGSLKKLSKDIRKSHATE